MNSREFKRLLLEQMLSLRDKLDQHETMLIAAKLKLSYNTIRNYMGGKMEGLRKLETAERIIALAEKMVARKEMTAKKDMENAMDIDMYDTISND